MLEYPQATATAKKDLEEVKFAFQEYTHLIEDTAKISDRRQIVNSIFVSMNVLFLSGIGYLISQHTSNGFHFWLLPIGCIVIAVIAMSLNNAWLKLSKQYRQLVDIRIAYLHAFEEFFRNSGYFFALPTTIKVTGEKRRYQLRGVYTLEDVLYAPDEFESEVVREGPSNAGQKVSLARRKPAKEPFGFSKAEQRMGFIFSTSYVAISVVVLALTVLTNFTPLLKGVSF